MVQHRIVGAIDFWLAHGWRPLDLNMLRLTDSNNNNMDHEKKYLPGRKFTDRIINPNSTNLHQNCSCKFIIVVQSKIIHLPLFACLIKMSNNLLFRYLYLWFVVIMPKTDEITCLNDRIFFDRGQIWREQINDFKKIIILWR